MNITALREKVGWLKARLLNLGGGRFCPACESGVRTFLRGGTDDRPGAQCPCCGAYERTRLAALYLRQMGTNDGAMGGEALHFAPERSLEKLLRKRFGTAYVSCDLEMPGVDVQADITNLPFEDERFSLILCSHVFEHVPDDRRALRELARVLRPDGQLILQVPVTAEVTVEDPNETDPAVRLARFGQEDHVRRYGPDCLERFRQNGLIFDVLTRNSLSDLFQQQCYGLESGATGDLYLGRHPVG